MNKVTLAARYLLALALTVFGINKFANFMAPATPGPEAIAYFTGLAQVHLMEVLGVIYLLSAIALATNRFVGLATVTIAAVVFNILLYHLVLDPANIMGGLVVAVLLVLTMIGNKEKYKGLLS